MNDNRMSSIEVLDILEAFKSNRPIDWYNPETKKWEFMTAWTNQAILLHAMMDGHLFRRSNQKITGWIPVMKTNEGIEWGNLSLVKIDKTFLPNCIDVVEVTWDIARFGEIL